MLSVEITTGVPLLGGHLGTYRWLIRTCQSNFLGLSQYTKYRLTNSHYQDEMAVRQWKSLSWWRHHMETFSALLAIYAGNSPVTGEFPAHRLVTRSYNVFFDLCLNERLSKQSWCWWFVTPSRPLWRHSNDALKYGLCVEISLKAIHKTSSWSS